MEKVSWTEEWRSGGVEERRSAGEVSQKVGSQKVKSQKIESQ